MTRIAFIGVGNIGLPMARNLLAAGHSLHAFDLSADALGAVVAAGASAAGSVAEAVQGASMVVSVLPEGDHVRAVYLGDAGVLAHADPNCLLIDCSTIDVASARAVASDAATAGFEMLDAPVSGGVSGAEAGTLTFMVGGADAAFARAAPVLSAMGKNLVHVGASGHGQSAKICNNMMAAIAITGASEALSLGQALGVDPAKLYEVISTSSGQTWALDSMCPVPGIIDKAASNRDFAPGFKAALMAKDLGLSQSAARDTGTSTPLGALTASLYRLLCQRGDGELDCSVIYKLITGAR